MSAPLDIEVLKAVAEKATPGTWRVDRGRRVLSNFNDGNHEVCATDQQWFANRGDHNPAFIAAANPAVVLALIARAEAAEARTAELVAQRDGLVEAARSFIPANLALDNANVPDDLVIPLDVAIAEFRALAVALFTIKAGGAE